MEKKLKRKKKAVVKKAIRKPDVNRFQITRNRLITFFSGVGLITLGFITLGAGSVSLSPVLLVLGFLAAIPLSFIIK